MNDLMKFVCCAAIAVVAGVTATTVLAQTSGFDPSAVYTAQQAGIRTKTIFEVVGKLDTASGGTDPRWGAGAFGGARTSADKRRLAELYNSYLRAGALCLEGRGYVIAK